jgi:hypothetical protein
MPALVERVIDATVTKNIMTVSEYHIEVAFLFANNDF